MHACVNVCIRECINAWMHVWMHECMHESIDAWMHTHQSGELMCICIRIGTYHLQPFRSNISSSGRQSSNLLLLIIKQAMSNCQYNNTIIGVTCSSCKLIQKCQTNILSFLTLSYLTNILPYLTNRSRVISAKIPKQFMRHALTLCYFNFLLLHEWRTAGIHTKFLSILITPKV